MNQNVAAVTRFGCLCLGMSAACGDVGRILEGDNPFAHGCLCLPDGYICDFTSSNPVDPELYSYTVEDVWSAVEGQWSGTFPGDHGIPAADIVITVQRLEGAASYMAPMVWGDYVLTDADRAECGGTAMAAYVHVESSVDRLDFDVPVVDITVRGHAMPGLLTDPSALWPTGVAFFSTEIADEGAPDHLEYAVVFESDGDFYMSATESGRNFLYVGRRE